MKVSPNSLDTILQTHRYFAQALDPIHIGTGGERLSRVDMAIIREPGTDLPKLPGTSLSGACRAYAAMQQLDGKPGRNCAGQGQEREQDGLKGKSHCGQGDCPICQTFGYAKGNDAGGKKGVAQFTDAHIVAFPVATAMGPLWLTSPMALGVLGLTPSVTFKPNEVGIAFSKQVKLPQSRDNQPQRIGVGWLALEVKANDFTVSGPKSDEQWPYLSNHPLGLVPDSIFSTIVNDNLEVRTSVAINPETGAAEDGALFTYEAIPTGTLFAFDITFQRQAIERSQQTVNSGLTLFAWLGVGGMNTRGMGRLHVLNLPTQEAGA